MGRRYSRIAAAAATAALVAGCAYNDHFDNRVDRFDIASEQARDQMILTNIVRASKAEPLAFLQIGKVTGVNSSSNQMGLPSLILGSGMPLVSKAGTVVPAVQGAHFLDQQWVFGANPGASGFSANSLTTSGSTTFDVNPSETKDFYRGLLLTVEPETLAFFLQQGVAPELLFYLFTDKIVEEKAGRVTQYVNDPLDPESFHGFQHYVELAMTYSIVAEPEPGAKAKSSNNSKKGPGADKNGGASDASSQDTQGPDWRLCFDRSAWGPDAKFADNHPMCGSHEKLANPRMVTFRDRKGELVKLQVFPRSTFAIFQYLGRIVAAGDAGEIKLKTADAIGYGSLQDDRLFVLNRSGSGSCFVAVDYGGGGYCVPDDAINTKRILGLLAQLLALNTSVRDISLTPEVRLIQ
ncbi:MAG: hypothetical protein ABSF67_06065 [Roseiarcus sp.]|jgi:hypothetical protein